MKLDLDKKDLISLVKGTDPNLINVMGDPKIRSRGSYGETYGRWDWNYRAFEGCSEQEIY